MFITISSYIIDSKIEKNYFLFTIDRAILEKKIYSQ